MSPVDVLVWTCTLVFVATSLITLLSLTGFIVLGGGDGERHDHYLNRLFTILVVEIVVVSVGSFGVYVTENQKYITEIVEQAAPSNIDTESIFIQ